MQVALLHAIRSPSKPLRHVVGTNVAVIVGVGGLPTWPELLMSIVQCLESNDPNALEGALDALYKVCSLHRFFSKEPMVLDEVHSSTQSNLEEGTRRSLIQRRWLLCRSARKPRSKWRARCPASPLGLHSDLPTFLYRGCWPCLDLPTRMQNASPCPS